MMGEDDQERPRFDEAFLAIDDELAEIKLAGGGDGLRPRLKAPRHVLAFDLVAIRVLNCILKSTSLN